MHPGTFPQVVMAHHTGYLRDAVMHDHGDGGQGDWPRPPRRAWLGWLRTWSLKLGGPRLDGRFGQPHHCGLGCARP